MFGGRAADAQRLIEAAANRTRVEALFILWTATLVIRDLHRCTAGRLASTTARLQARALACWRAYEPAQRRAAITDILRLHGSGRLDLTDSSDELPDSDDSDADGWLG